MGSNFCCWSYRFLTCSYSCLVSAVAWNDEVFFDSLEVDLDDDYENESDDDYDDESIEDFFDFDKSDDESFD